MRLDDRSSRRVCRPRRSPQSRGLELSFAPARRIRRAFDVCAGDSRPLAFDDRRGAVPDRARAGAAGAANAGHSPRGRPRYRDVRRTRPGTARSRRFPVRLGGGSEARPPLNSGRRRRGPRRDRRDSSQLAAPGAYRSRPGHHRRTAGFRRLSPAHRLAVAASGVGRQGLPSRLARTLSSRGENGRDPLAHPLALAPSHGDALRPALGRGSRRRRRAAARRDRPSACRRRLSGRAPERSQPRAMGRGSRPRRPAGAFTRRADRPCRRRLRPLSFRGRRGAGEMGGEAARRLAGRRRPARRIVRLGQAVRRRGSGHVDDLRRLAHSPSPRDRAVHGLRRRGRRTLATEDRDRDGRSVLAFAGP